MTMAKWTIVKLTIIILVMINFDMNIICGLID
jgi:hypothetical protein